MVKKLLSICNIELFLVFGVILFFSHKIGDASVPAPTYRPGMAPARKSFPTDNPLSVAAIIIGRLGGIIGPTVEDAAVMAQEKSLS